MRKGYLGETGEQVHYHEMGEGGTALMCLPPAPHTSVFFETVMPLLAKQRLVRALDYPGYGGSDRLRSRPSIKAYAERLSEGLKATPSFDLLGFHTGNLVAAEIAKIIPDNVNKIIMIDVPNFDEATRKNYASGTSEGELSKNFDEAFEKTVENRSKVISEDRAYALWVESLRSGRFKNDAFFAAFDYDCEVQFHGLTVPIHIIATQSSLLEPSRKTAAFLKNAILTEALDIKAPVFEAFAMQIAEKILSV